MVLVVVVVLVCCIVDTVIGGCTYDSDRYVTYRGCERRGHNGEYCGNWMQAGKWGDEEFIRREEAAENGVGDHNYCRNPGGLRHGVWCYQAYTGKKIYCRHVTDKNCVTQPQDDTQCPEAHKKRGGTIDTQPSQPSQPEIEHLYPMLAGTLQLTCEEGCSEAVLWKSRAGLNAKSVTSNNLTIHPVTKDTAGDWECSCGKRRHVKKVKICTITWSVCRQVKGLWYKEGTNTCTARKVTGDCTPSEEVNTPGQEGDSTEQSQEYERYLTEDPSEGDSGDAQARKEGRRGSGEEESCSGSECGFCQDKPAICGALGCLAGAITVVAAVFVKKSLQWRRQAKESQANVGGTLETQLTGTQSYSRQIAHMNQLNYDQERALRIEGLVSQLGTQRRNPGLSCSTSVTDTMHLQHLRQHDQLGMIRSEELQSSDNIPCQRLEDSEMLIHPPNDHLDHLAGTLPRAAVTLPRADVTLPRVQLILNQEEPDPPESNRNTARRPGLEDAARHRDGTLFDKYFDQDVDKWSINQEVEI